MLWVVISYNGRFNLLWIEGNLHSNRYVHEVLQSKVVPFIQGSLVLSFSTKMDAHNFKDFSRLLFSPTHASSQLVFLFAGYVAYWARVEFGWSACCPWSSSCSFKRRILAARIIKMEFYSTSRHSKYVSLHLTLYSSIYCSSWWLHPILILDFFIYLFIIFCFENSTTH